jgi:hypothetical protein
MSAVLSKKLWREQSNFENMIQWRSGSKLKGVHRIHASQELSAGTFGPTPEFVSSRQTKSQAIRE